MTREDQCNEILSACRQNAQSRVHWILEFILICCFLTSKMHFWEFSYRWISRLVTDPYVWIAAFIHALWPISLCVALKPKKKLCQFMCHDEVQMVNIHCQKCFFLFSQVSTDITTWLVYNKFQMNCNIIFKVFVEIMLEAAWIYYFYMWAL